MLEYFATRNNVLTEVSSFEHGSWIALTEPSLEEILLIEEVTGVEPHLLRAALDADESPHIDKEDEQILIVIDTVVRSDMENELYETLPLGIIRLKNCIITICSNSDTFIEEFKTGKIKDFYTQFKTRFLLQFLNRNATQYLRSLRVIDKLSSKIEKNLSGALKNKELLEMLRIEKSLVYFSTSLRSNQTVLDRLLRFEQIKNYPEDQDLLENVIIENRQALETCDVYVNIIGSIMETYASIISNNQNDVMKVLTSVSVVISVPTIISGLWGMNVPVPMQSNPLGFIILIAITVALMIILIIFLRYIRML